MRHTRRNRCHFQTSDGGSYRSRPDGVRLAVAEALENRVLLAVDLLLPNSAGEEPSVAINPTNPKNVVVAQFAALWISTDGGVSFPLEIGALLPPAQRSFTSP